MEGASPPEQRFCFEPLLARTTDHKDANTMKRVQDGISAAGKYLLDAHGSICSHLRNQGHRSSDPAGCSIGVT